MEFVDAEPSTPPIIPIEGIEPTKNVPNVNSGKRRRVYNDEDREIIWRLAARSYKARVSVEKKSELREETVASKTWKP